ncbi:MarR family winged helix-turn-helix transcriptional regulator [Demequina mangrovi]|uniref:DNA-binding transcriptional regulator, MarR family n=1 Tax=Demequina mangrovi TaxID=1043493 RepID=A0A1H7AEJ4_9MICO|nr:MarR family transcriptional regulator [Demequina mangrovi]SEJ64051.1 DNA-binding transcriptional regulator, MarR family [Demequina mangrovi]
MDAQSEAPRLLYLVKRLELAVRARLDAVLREHRITVPQYTALTVLARHPAMTAAELARHSFVSAQAMDGVVRALLQADLIERSVDPAHARRLVISLTPAATALLADCAPDVDGIEAAAFGALAEEERTALARWLGEARAGLAPSRAATPQAGGVAEGEPDIS